MLLEVIRDKYICVDPLDRPDAKKPQFEDKAIKCEFFIPLVK